MFQTHHSRRFNIEFATSKTHQKTSIVPKTYLKDRYFKTIVTDTKLPVSLLFTSTYNTSPPHIIFGRTFDPAIWALFFRGTSIHFPYGILSESRCNTRRPHLPLVLGLSIVNFEADWLLLSKLFSDSDDLISLFHFFFYWFALYCLTDV